MGPVSDGSENGARADGSPGYGTTGETAPETAAAGGSSIGNGGGTPPTINGGDEIVNARSGLALDDHAGES